MSIEPTTLIERYSRAVHTSRLVLSEHRRTDADVILAAGLCGHTSRPQTIGPMLLRLMVEYDEVRGARAVARRNFDDGSSRDATKAHAEDVVTREKNRRARQFTELEGRRPRADESMMTSDEIRELVIKAAEAQRDQLAHNAKMAHAFVLMNLPSLATTKQAFGDWAMQMAERRRFMTVSPIAAATPATEIPAATLAWRQAKKAQLTVVSALAGRVLDLLLDPNCYRCEGRGFNGGYDHSPQKICNDIRKGGCGGSGKRNTKIGKTREEDEFAGYLMMEVDIMLGRVTREMKARLRDEPPAMAGLVSA